MKLGIRAPVCSLTGYAETARSIIAGLDKLGVDIYLDMVDKDMYESSKPALTTELTETLDRITRPIPRKVPVFTIGTPVQYYTHPDHFKIGIGLFEAYGIPQAWLMQMNKMQLLLTFSEFNREVFIKHGINKERIEVIPPAVDSTRFHPNVLPFYVHAVRPFTILFLGQLILRKGWDKLLIAALRAFGRFEDVCVLLKLPPVYYEAQTSEMISKIRAVKEEAGSSKVPVYFNNLAIPVEKIPRVYQIPRQTLRGHKYPHLAKGIRGVFALPSLSEGIGLPYLEAMASGLLVLGTNTTGSSFLTARNSVIVEAGPPRRDLRLEMEATLYRGAPFPSISSDAVADALRRAYEMNEVDSQKITRQARREVESYTYENCSKLILQHIQNHL